MSRAVGHDVCLKNKSTKTTLQGFTFKAITVAEKHTLILDSTECLAKSAEHEM